MPYIIPQSGNVLFPHIAEKRLKAPELGPRVLFFSGGSSLKRVSQELIRYTHNTIHILTAMDSGGSSAALRKAFHMPAIGDIRHRLLALTDPDMNGHAAIYKLFSHRLSADGEPLQLQTELTSLAAGRHPLLKSVGSLQPIVRDCLTCFMERMPADIDLRNASIGNLILAGGYLHQNQHINAIIQYFSRVLHVRGTVKPVTDQFLHLCAELKDGEIVMGQHRLTGKESPPLTKPVARLFYTKGLDSKTEVEVRLTAEVADLITQADLICFPMGSFYSSLIANCLPSGIGEAISRNPCPKVFIPNTTPDPELYGKSLADQVRELLYYLRLGEKNPLKNHQLLNLVLLDETHAGYPSSGAINENGIQVLKCRLMDDASRPLISEKLLAAALISLST